MAPESLAETWQISYLSAVGGYYSECTWLPTCQPEGQLRERRSFSSGGVRREYARVCYSFWQVAK